MFREDTAPGRSPNTTISSALMLTISGNAASTRRSCGKTTSRPSLVTTRVIPFCGSWRGLLAGVLLAFCRAIGEFGATIIVAGNIPGRTQTLALAIYDRINSGNDNQAMQFVVYVILIAITAIIGSELLIRRQRRRISR